MSLIWLVTVVVCAVNHYCVTSFDLEIWPTCEHKQALFMYSTNGKNQFLVSKLQGNIKINKSKCPKTLFWLGLMVHSKHLSVPLFWVPLPYENCVSWVLQCITMLNHNGQELTVVTQLLYLWYLWSQLTSYECLWPFNVRGT